MINVRLSHPVLLIALLLGLGLNATPAVALKPAVEVAPPVAELQLPSSAQPAVETPLDAVTEPQGANIRSSGPSGDPCPTLKSATENDPDDLAKVQEDIDRFTLCVQRAQLLERLNESAIKSEASTDAALGLSDGSMAGVPMPGVTPGMPPLPASAMAEPAAAPITTQAPGNAPSVIKVETTTTTPAPESTWLIREIFGSSVDMQARLLSPQGDEVKVKTGTRLPDGAAVTTITPSGVSIRSGKTVKTLEWAGS